MLKVASFTYGLLFISISFMRNNTQYLLFAYVCAIVGTDSLVHKMTTFCRRMQKGRKNL